MNIEDISVGMHIGWWDIVKENILPYITGYVTFVELSPNVKHEEPYIDIRITGKRFMSIKEILDGKLETFVLKRYMRSPYKIDLYPEPDDKRCLFKPEPIQKELFP